MGETWFQGQPCARGHPGTRYVSTGSCIDCHKLRTAEGRRSSKEAQKEYERRYRARHGDRVKEIADAWRSANPQKSRQYRSDWRQSNYKLAREIETASVRRRRDSNCPKFRELERNTNSKRRARKRGGESTATAGQIRWLKEMQHGGCAYCGSNERLELDHKIALARGGHHVLPNLQWLCRFHNQDKRTMPDAEYRRRCGIPMLTPWDWRTRLLDFIA